MTVTVLKLKNIVIGLNTCPGRRKICGRLHCRHGLKFDNAVPIDKYCLYALVVTGGTRNVCFDVYGVSIEKHRWQCTYNNILRHFRFISRLSYRHIDYPYHPYYGCSCVGLGEGVFVSFNKMFMFMKERLNNPCS
jgi:hypothetical protein